jgi:hypothetical protein
MKILNILVTAALAATIGACQRDAEPNTPEPTTAEKVAGKWKLQKVNIDYYYPITVLDDTVRYTGSPGDSLVFKPNGKIYSYDGSPAPDTIPYSLAGDTHITIDGERFQIRELTAVKFRLYADSVNTLLNERTITDVYLVR